MSSVKQYVRLTKEQQQRLRKHHASTPGLTQRELADWAVATFKLVCAPSRSTLHRALLRTDKEALRPAAKTIRRTSCPLLEERLLRWIRASEAWKLPIVTCATIREKAAKIRDDIVADDTHAASAELKKMVFSSGWLCKFQRRHGLTSKRVCGEAASVDASSVEEGRKRLQELTQCYAKRDVFNLDETAFFYCAHPTRSISSRAIAGRKQSKKRITVAIACNADGSTKLPLLFVGMSRRPRCFDGKSCDQLGVEYESSPRAWMTRQLFERWAQRFNERMRDENRHVLLLVDNAPSHQLKEPLSHVTLQFLPPNTTSVLQPQDAGIIRQFKAQLQARQTRHIVDWFDAFLRRADEGEEHCASELDKAYNVDVLVAMRWAQEAWEAVTAKVIDNCWQHTQVLDESLYELVDKVQMLTLV